MKLRNDDTAVTSRPVNTIEPGREFLFLYQIIENELDAISTNSDNIQQVTDMHSTRQRNPSVSSSCPSVNQELPTRPKG